MRSEHLKAVLSYALEQMETTGIEVLDFGPTSSDRLNGDEAKAAVEDMLHEVECAVRDSSSRSECELRLVEKTRR